MAKTPTSKKRSKLRAPTSSRIVSAESKTPMVAIGASAGGLEPFERFFDAMPSDSGFAFVVIQHLSPDFESMMDELLARHSKMDIERVVHDLPVKANTIYLNPARSDMVVEDGLFKLNPRPQNNQLNLPIDIFFASLAKEYQEKAIAIVLSGTGSDGTRGASIVKGEGGTVIAQALASAKFDGMPRSVIEAGSADAIATPSDMPLLLTRLQSGKSITDTDLADISDDPARYAFNLLRDKFGTDFGYYKEATLIRRFERRAQLGGEDVEAYARRLAKDAEELDALYADLLIDVTSFFRDRKGFAALIKNVIYPLGEKMTHDRQIRVWVPGCSSGEEAYSIAIAFAEYARNNNTPLNLKILATDVHQRSLGAAAQGIYPKSSLSGLSDEQIERYFEKHVDYYQINQNLRRLVVFSQHNLLRDPPFTRIDFVSCRNVLIYFQDKAQEKTLALFHFALTVNGYLFLGPSESLNKLEDEFETLERRWNIYRKLRDVRLMEATSLLPRNSTNQVTQDFKAPFLGGRTATLQRFQRAHTDALEILLKEYAPAGFLLNKSGEIVHVFGKGGEFVKIDGGIFSNRIVDLIHPQLNLAVTSGLERINASDKLEYQRRVILSNEDKPDQSVLVSMRSIADNNRQAGHVLLTLEAARETLSDQDIQPQFLDTNETSHIMQQRIYDLERDLKSTEQSLQSMVEELQTSNEELQATNEELMASNEELQSTNEELHSVNEELYTVSAEHQRKIDELTVLSDDMNHLLKATSIGIVFLDEHGRIRRFTASATAAFNLLDQDVGRPFEHTTYRFQNIDLEEIMQSVRSTRKPSEHEIIVGDKEYLLSVLPYTTSVKHASGIVMTIVDVSELKMAEKERLAQKQIFETVVSDLSEAVMRVRLNDGVVVLCNEIFAALYNKDISQIVGKPLVETVGEDLARLTFDAVKGQKSGTITNAHLTLNKGHSNERILQRHIRIIGDDEGNPTAFQSTGLDVTEQFRYSEALEDLIAVEDTPGIDFDSAIKKILEIGCRYFRLPNGLSLKLQGDHCAIEQIHSDDGAKVQVGDIFPVEATLNKNLSHERVPLSFANIKGSPFKNKDIYKNQEIKSYIGVRTMTSQGTHGILSFTGKKPREKEFSNTERTMIQLLARNVGALLERKMQYATLEERKIELENLNEGLNRFTYLASHDLQEPLRKIQQSGEFLESDYRELLDTDGHYFLKIMRDSAARMRSLIDDLLLYSTSANQALDTKPANFNSLLKEALSEMKDGIKSANAEFKIDDLPNVMCDETVVKQVFINIIGNSLKYRKADVETKVSITMKKGSEATEFRFDDNGIGLDLSNDINIFEPFVRLHAKTDYEGSGIGLAICKSVCDRHNWGIKADSKLGKGLAITLIIPNTHIYN